MLDRTLLLRSYDSVSLEYQVYSGINDTDKIVSKVEEYVNEECF